MLPLLYQGDPSLAKANIILLTYVSSSYPPHSYCNVQHYPRQDMSGTQQMQTRSLPRSEAGLGERTPGRELLALRTMSEVVLSLLAASTGGESPVDAASREARILENLAGTDDGRPMESHREALRWRYNDEGRRPLADILAVTLWAISHRAWNKYMHALHGNTDLVDRSAAIAKQAATLLEERAEVDSIAGRGGGTCIYLQPLSDIPAFAQQEMESRRRHGSEGMRIAR